MVTGLLRGCGLGLLRGQSSSGNAGAGELQMASPSIIAAAGMFPWPTGVPFDGIREVSIFSTAVAPAVASVGAPPQPSSSHFGMRAVSRFSPFESADPAADAFDGAGPSSIVGSDGGPQPQPLATGQAVSAGADPNSPTVAVSDSGSEAGVLPETLGTVLENIRAAEGSLREGML